MCGISVYEKMPKDQKAVYFTREFFDVCADGSVDVSDVLQDAVNTVVQKAGYGVLFVPEGKYLLSHTIYVPKAVRIIGCGKERPLFILKDNALGFNSPMPNDKGGYRYLFWFVNTLPKDGCEIEDANPGTFYSAISNVNVNLGKGNPYAVAFRTHYAQNSFLSHIDIHVDSGMAGIYDVGNEMDDVLIEGGQYGIITTKTSPGWPFVMVDVTFSGQENAAIRTREAGLTIIRCQCVSALKFIDVDEGYYERIYVEDSVFEDLDCLLNIALDENSLSQVCLKNCQLKAVEDIAVFKDSKRKITNDDYQCVINSYVHGTVAKDMLPDKQLHDQIYRRYASIDRSVLETDIPLLPMVGTWTNAVELGLKGDGKTDNTKALNDALLNNDVIYFPQGNYVFSDTITLREGNVLIGMNPISTSLILKENSERFAGFGRQKAFIETSKGKNIISGLGVRTGGKNPRACGVLWKAKVGSYMNDVKFLGGHGDLEPGTGEFIMPYDTLRTCDADPTKIWDYQYSSLLVCDNGGGTFKDIWSASPYAKSGLEVRDTSAKSKFYCLSLEHHCRHELYMEQSQNITIYGFQSEEEKAEGEHVVPIEMSRCENITFATAYFFRTVFVQNTLPFCVKIWDCKDIHFFNVSNFSQTKYTTDNFLLDGARNIELRPWQAAMIDIDGEGEDEGSPKTFAISDIKPDGYRVKKLCGGFRFADGGCCDKRGNFYFIDSSDKKIYKIDADTFKLSLFFESPYKINSLAFDTRDNIVVVGEYAIPDGEERNKKPHINVLPPDSFGTSYGYWYNPQAQIVAFTITGKGEIDTLEKVNIGDITPLRVLYPGNRYRDGSDFADVLSYNPGKAFLAPDELTIMPCHYDLIRANNLSSSKPGKSLYTVDEVYRRVYSCDVDDDGLLKNPCIVAQEGEYQVRKVQRRLLIGDDDIRIYEEGKRRGSVHIPERPVTFDIGGNKKNKLFVTTRNNIYVVEEE